MPEKLVIRTFGAFSVSVGGKTISDQSARSQKLWLVFKYLITNRGNATTTETLIEALWPDEQPQYPLKSLQSLIVRLRKLLNADGIPDRYILFMHNSYFWNPDMYIDLDVAHFESLILQARGQTTDEGKRPFLEDAINLYTGDYLHETASEIWVMPVTSYYKRTYLRAVEELHDIYVRAAAYEEAIGLCNSAIKNEPYDETLYERLIHALLINGEITLAKERYRHITDIMRKQFGAQPSDELQMLYREMREMNMEQPSDPVEIKRSIERDGLRRGAYFCTSSAFRRIYQLDMRSDERMKFPLFFAVVTVMVKENEPDPNILRSSSQTLRQCLMRTLRKGDVISQHSQHQFLVLLSAYQSKDAETALTRVKKQFAAEPSGLVCDLNTHLFRTGCEESGGDQMLATFGYNRQK